MIKSGFSMVELVFVIVILGVLASIAVPRLSSTRMDAQVAVLRSDLASAMKAVPAKVFAENIDVSQVPNGFSGWGEWMIDITGLDKGRWTIAINVNGISPRDSYSKLPCSGNGVLQISNGDLIFDPSLIKVTSSQERFCQAIRDSYPSDSKRVISLVAGSAKFY